MKPATRLTALTPHLYCWSSLHTEWNVDFSSQAVLTPAGVFFVDPLKPAAAVLKKLTTLGEPAGIFLTNANHDRDAEWFRKHFAIQIYAHEKTPPDCDLKIDVPVLDGEKLPGGLCVLHLPGHGAGEAALHSREDGGFLLIGDAILNSATEGLHFLPDKYYADLRQARRSVRRLLDCEYQTATFAHGPPLTGNAKQQLADFLSQQTKKKKS